MLCQCEQRIRDAPIQYWTLIDGMIDAPQGPQPGLKLEAHALCLTSLAVRIDEHVLEVRLLDSNAVIRSGDLKIESRALY